MLISFTTDVSLSIYLCIPVCLAKYPFQIKLQTSLYFVSLTRVQILFRFQLNLHTVLLFSESLPLAFLKNIKYAQILSIKLNEFCQTYTPKS